MDQKQIKTYDKLKLLNLPGVTTPTVKVVETIIASTKEQHHLENKQLFIFV